MAQKIQDNQKKLKSPFIPGFWEVVIPEKVWDQDYITYELKDYVVKSGEGDEDFVVKTKVIEHRDNIAEVIAKDADSVGVANLIERVLRTGDESLLPPPLGNEGRLDDGTLAPDNLLDAVNMAEEAYKTYESLPEELRKGRDLEQFANSFTAQEFIDFLTAQQKKVEPQEKKDGDN